MKARCLRLAATFVIVCLVAVEAATAQTTRPTTQPRRPRPLLRVTQDESSMEKAIAAYIQEKDGVAAEEKLVGEDKSDLYLVYPVTIEGAPKINVVVDTEATARDADKKVTSRAVQITAYYILADNAKKPDIRAKILELNNKWHQQNWAPNRIYVDADGDVCLETYIDIPSADVTVHAELVREAKRLMGGAWANYYKELSALLPAAPAAQPPAAGDEDNGDDDE